MIKTIVRAKEIPFGVKVKVRENDLVFFEDINFQNYFYVSKEEFPIFRDIIYEESKYFLSIEEDNRGVKLTLKNNFDRYKIKSKLELKGVKLYEADLMTHKRWLIDSKLNLNSEKLKWLMYDIETKDDSIFEKDMRGSIIAREPILSIAYYDQEGNSYWIKNKNLQNPEQGERELLNFHNKIMKEYDIIAGWNSYRFDDTYVKQRMEFHQISLKEWDFINQLDYMEIVKKNLYPTIPSYSLNNVANHVLGDTKLEGVQAGKGNIYKLWKKSFEGDDQLEKYNIQDVKLMFDMDKKLNFLNLHMKQADIAGCFIQETIHNSEVWDVILLSKYKENNLLAPTKPSKNEVEERKNKCFVAGAYTFCLNPGFHENVDVFDFKSFYPTTITACNICPTTIIKSNLDGLNQIKIPEDIHFVSTAPGNWTTRKKDLGNSFEALQSFDEIRVSDQKGFDIKFAPKYFTLEKRGILADTMDMYIEERDKTKYLAKTETDPVRKMELKSIEWSYKTLANSGYGVMAQQSFRFFDEDVANAITQFCRFTIKKCIEIAEAKGFQVIQGDTDSIMFKNLENKYNIKDLEEAFFDYFDRLSDENNIKSKKFKLTHPKTGEIHEKDHFIVFEHEKTFNRMISIKKKNYADLMQEMDGDGNPIGEPKISITGLECIKKDTNPLAKKMQKELIEDILFKRFNSENWLLKISETKVKILNNKLDSQYLIMSKSLNKNIDEYGKATIDSKTGLPKLKKDGTQMFAPIPAHVKLAKKLIEEGQDIYVGDQINYIVKEQKPIVAISVSEYNNGEDYDREYYWDRIITPIMKILFVTHSKLILDNPELWSIKELDEKKLQKYIDKLKKNCMTEEED